MDSQLEIFQSSYNETLNNASSFPIFWTLGLAFLGGLISSLLPCVLSLLPINLAYIGTLNIDNKTEAFKKAFSFVLGVALVLSLLGVSASFAFAVFTAYRGIISLIIGLIITIMALSLLDIIKIHLPQIFNKMPNTNPFIVGMIFALVSSPCSSPVLISVVTIAASLGSIPKSLALMFSFSMGYTAIIFFTSLFTGLIKQLTWFKANSTLITKLSAATLGLIGIFYIIDGVKNLF